jgi:broad specificity polyphosphatase/5'/3'-nucleotidase SurE
LLLNLNFPNCKQKNIKGLKIVNCSNQKYSDEIIIDNKHSTFKIGKMNVFNNQKVDDLNALKNGYITLSSLLTNLSNKTFTTNYEL